MDERDGVVMKRETLKIEGDRNLYLYTFEVEPAAAKPDESAAQPAAEEPERP